ncbi:MAG: sigma-70 family RNA polymerase sigma factor [Bacteroidetes bacterium]|nr:MAG: sigma-70 family RNA polymerase sigma factor [Bacteroidota bacterium]
MKKDAQANHSWKGLTDETLICLVLSGRTEACDILLQRHEPLLRFVIRRYLSDPEMIQEVIHDTFLRALRALPGFRREAKFSTWLCTIAASQAINRLRARRQPAWEQPEEVLQNWEDDLYINGLALERQETRQALRQAINRLSPKDTTAIELFYFHEQSITEISQITGWTATTIKSRLCRARQRLRTLLEPYNIHSN